MDSLWDINATKVASGLRGCGGLKSSVLLQPDYPFGDHQKEEVNPELFLSRRLS